MVQKGKFSAAAWLLVNTLKKVDFPTLGIPTIPTFKLVPTRPISGFRSGSSIFFGAILGKIEIYIVIIFLFLPPSFLPQFDPSREKRRFIFSTLLTRGSRQTEEKKKTIYQYLHIHGARVRGRRNENDSAFVGIRAPRPSSSSIPTLGIFNICPRPCLERNQRGRVK